jgi:hypothetical protein
VAVDQFGDHHCPSKSNVNFVLDVGGNGKMETWKDYGKKSTCFYSVETHHQKSLYAPTGSWLLTEDQLTKSFLELALTLVHVGLLSWHAMLHHFCC